VTAEMLQFFIQSGIPAGLGVFIIYYLLQFYLPREQSLYQEMLKSQQKTFRDAITSEQKTHTELMTQLGTQHRDSLQQLRDAFADEHGRTRSSLDKLSEQTARLSEAVFRLQGIPESEV